MLATLVAPSRMPSPYAGLPHQTVDFLAELAANNTREWFQAHRADYEASFLEPARALVRALGERLPELGPGVRAEPKVFGSILTINRDVRFSTDKTPYKSYLDLWFPQGEGPSRERPGYFLRLRPTSLLLGAGMHVFHVAALERYRETLLNDAERRESLEALADALDAAELGGQTHKRTPPGVPSDHPGARWLRHNGLFAETERPLSPEVFSPGLVDLCLGTFGRYQPLQQWLVDLLDS
jgi:uncharacterized protein (TIGR02453 family)